MELTFPESIQQPSSQWNPSGFRNRTNHNVRNGIMVSETDQTTKYPSQTKPNHASPSQSERSQPNPSRSKPSQATPNNSKPSQTKPSQAGPGQARLSQARPGQAMPSQTKEPNQPKPITFAYGNRRRTATDPNIAKTLPWPLRRLPGKAAKE